MNVAVKSRACQPQLFLIDRGSELESNQPNSVRPVLKSTCINTMQQPNPTLLVLFSTRNLQKYCGQELPLEIKISRSLKSSAPCWGNHRCQNIPSQSGLDPKRPQPSVRQNSNCAGHLPAERPPASLTQHHHQPHSLTNILTTLCFPQTSSSHPTATMGLLSQDKVPPPNPTQPNLP